jgi:hypothetical protein
MAAKKHKERKEGDEAVAGQTKGGWEGLPGHVKWEGLWSRGQRAIGGNRVFIRRIPAGASRGSVCAVSGRAYEGFPAHARCALPLPVFI